MTGTNLTFVYDDYRTVLVGTWVKGNMIEARKARIKGFRCNDGLLELKTTKVHKHQQAFVYEPIGKNFITSQPTLMDPLDQASVYIGSSSNPNIPGEGIFARREIQTGSHISHYAGALIKVTEIDFDSDLSIIELNETIFFPNMSLDEREQRHKNMMVFNSVYIMDCNDDDIVTYRATLGHKANHAFDANAKFCLVKSPRFGEIFCLEAIKDISKGQEVFVDYGYRLSHWTTPRWYKALYFETYPQAGKTLP